MVLDEKGLGFLRRWGYAVPEEKGYGSLGEGVRVPEEKGLWFLRRWGYGTRVEGDMVLEEKGLGFLRGTKVEKGQNRSLTAELEWVWMTSKNVHSL